MTTTTTITLPGGTEWYDTGISVTSGDTLGFTASGSVTINLAGKTETPAGDSTVSTMGTAVPFAAPGLTAWSLVGRVGTSGTPFEIGTGTSAPPTAPATGELYLSVNDNYFGDNSGSWSVSITRGATFGTIAQLSDYLINGYWNDQILHPPHHWKQNNITYNISGLTVPEQKDAKAALAAWQSVCNVTFTETPGTADITYIDTVNRDTNGNIKAVTTILPRSSIPVQ
jgi:hypothetical protein